MKCIYHHPKFEIFDPRQTKSRGWLDVMVFSDSNTISSPSNLVVVTEPIKPDGQYAQEGISVTNSIEIVATNLFNYGYGWKYLIEHYPERSSNRKCRRENPGGWIDPLNEETFDRVTFKLFQPDSEIVFGSAAWDHFTRAQMNTIVGAVFPEWHGDLYDNVPRWPPSTVDW